MEILGALLGFVVLVLWIWALIDILKSDFKDNINKIIWLLVVLLLNFLGVLLYYFIGRGQKA
jgi:membrane protein DedA with SNARE-associated domain